jgi:hypothetical protein
MADSYLSIAEIASDGYMTQRMRACVTQQDNQGTIDVADAERWVGFYAYTWASSPTWGEKWDSARASHPDNPAYQPGRDAAVITDGDILSTVQTLGTSLPDPTAPAP